MSDEKKLVKDLSNTKVVICKSCGYEGQIITFPVAMSVYKDISCPRCGSTNNVHNNEYQKNLLAAMKDSANACTER